MALELNNHEGQYAIKTKKPSQTKKYDPIKPGIINPGQKQISYFFALL